MGLLPSAMDLGHLCSGRKEDPVQIMAAVLPKMLGSIFDHHRPSKAPARCAGPGEDRALPSRAVLSRRRLEVGLGQTTTTSGPGLGRGPTGRHRTLRGARRPARRHGEGLTTAGRRHDTTGGGRLRVTTAAGPATRAERPIQRLIATTGWLPVLETMASRGDMMVTGLVLTPMRDGARNVGIRRMIMTITGQSQRRILAELSQNPPSIKPILNTMSGISHRLHTWSARCSSSSSSRNRASAFAVRRQVASTVGPCRKKLMPQRPATADSSHAS
mmetsp:Transcript_152531/g.487415  ORF Transcript_152531/g.487415 Transcript_152531/m.487415 type:complete len:273 (-) Transcript_152531:1151-1969(-)